MNFIKKTYESENTNLKNLVKKLKKDLENSKKNKYFKNNVRLDVKKKKEIIQLENEIRIKNNYIKGLIKEIKNLKKYRDDKSDRKSFIGNNYKID